MPIQYLDIKFQNLFPNFVPSEMVLINKGWHLWQSSKWSGIHNDVMTRKLMSTLDSPHKKPEMKALIFSLMFYWMNCWTNIWNAYNLRCHEAHVASLSWFSETAISNRALFTVVVYRLPGWCNIYSHNPNRTFCGLVYTDSCSWTFLWWLQI